MGHKKKTDMKKVNNGISEAIMGFNPTNLGVQLSQVDTLFINNRWYMISNMRQVLSQLYVEHGIVQTIIDVPVDDGFRGGIEVNTKQLDESQIKEIYHTMKRNGDLKVAAQACKWNRLFGGAGILILTGGDPAKPLDIQREVKEGYPLEFRALDMWELFWSRQNTSDYSLSIDAQDFEVEYFDYYGIQVHKSRVLRMKGIEAPSFVRPRLRGWGFSKVEALVRSINQYLKSTNLTFEVLDEFKVDVFGIKELNSTMLSEGGEEAIRKRVQFANREKNFQHAITMDSEDTYQAKELSFAGIAEVQAGIRMQVASDMRMPLTKIFGVSSAGFNSGEDDIENYNSMVEGEVREKVEFEVLELVKIRCQQLFGFIPDDLEIDFKPLRVLSAEAEENVKTSKFNRLLAAAQARMISGKTFAEGCNKDNLLPVQINPSEAESLKVEADEDEAAKISETSKSSLESPQAKNEVKKTIGVMGVVCDGFVLVGKRKDTGLWTFPAGSAELGEDGLDAAIRECYEETGIYVQPEMVVAMPVKNVRRDDGMLMDIHGFVAELDERIYPKTIMDPDCEFETVRWVPIDKQVHELKDENKHVKNDNDVIIKYLWRVYAKSKK